MNATHAEALRPASPGASARAALPGEAASPPSPPDDTFETVAALLARPKTAPPDSFVLHAPLELLARAALLPLVRAGARPAARRRIVALGAAYRAAGAELDEPEPGTPGEPADEVARLAAAIDAGDLEATDRAADRVAAALAPDALARALGADVIPRLGAAAHGGIFLYHLPRIAPGSRQAARALRGLARDLALEHAWKLTWHRERAPLARDADTRSPADVRSAAAELAERLRRPPSPGDPGSSFIYPTMSIVERTGLAAELLDAPTRALDVPAARRTLFRIAALSMLQDDPDHAPYGWTHCLSMAQGTLGIAEASGDAPSAIAVAATYVLGFRATLGKVALDLAWRPEPPAMPIDLREIAAHSPAEAAAAAWHAPLEAAPALEEALATAASLHHDAHLVKYVVACLDAAATDPEARRLYLAAAAYLAAWWRER